MSATEKPWIYLCKVVLTFASLYEILKCNNLDESY